MSYIGNTPGVSSQRIVDSFIATSNQTTFTTSSGYTPGYVDVYLNGVKLVASDDFTASTGSTIVLATGASAGDSVEIVAYLPRGLSDGYLKSEADARYVALTGNQTVAGVKTFSSQLVGIAGTAGAPAITTTGDLDTGIFFPAVNTLAFSTNGTEDARFDASGNLGVGTSSPQSYTNYKIIHVAGPATNGSGLLYFTNSNNSLVGIANADGANSLITFGSQTNHAVTFKTNDTERARISSAGSLLIGATSQGYANLGYMLGVQSGGTQTFISIAKSGQTLDTGGMTLGIDTTGGAIYVRPAQPLDFYTSDTFRMRITSGGNLVLGATSGAAKLYIIGDNTNPNIQTGGSGGGVGGITENFHGDIFFSYADLAGQNTANANLKVGRIGATGRSINAGGTINASGADYAEYMTKCSNEFVVAKGDVVGVNANGKLTNVFADAVSFVVKSTDPSYVGGDSWGVKSDDKDGEQYTEEELEAQRQLVDRIAFSGQVPVNVTGATPGQYIVPVDDNGSIKGEAVSNPTFEQYQLAVGKVIAIEQDGRARIIVKVA